MYKVNIMKRTNIEIDPILVNKAKKLSKLSTTKDVVNLALENLIKSLNRRKIGKMYGKVEWEGDLDEMRRS